MADLLVKLYDIKDCPELIDELEEKEPEHRTSPPFITEPTAKAGIPTIVYECYSYEPMDLTYELALKLIESIDNLSF